MIHYAFVSALISLAVILGCTAAAFFAGLGLGSVGDVGGEAMGGGGMLAMLFAPLGALLAVLVIILNYAWGGWW